MGCTGMNLSLHIHFQTILKRLAFVKLIIKMQSKTLQILHNEILHLLELESNFVTHPLSSETRNFIFLINLINILLSSFATKIKLKKLQNYIYIH